MSKISRGDILAEKEKLSIGLSSVPSDQISVPIFEVFLAKNHWILMRFWVHIALMVTIVVTLPYT
jgi:hypothetical protein